MRLIALALLSGVGVAAVTAGISVDSAFLRVVGGLLLGYSNVGFVIEWVRND